jgi:hypothetical protein
MSVPAFTYFHVALSLLGIASGLVVVLGMLNSRQLPGWTLVFLLSTIATSATGFLFHSIAFGPPHIVGVLSLLALIAAVMALYAFHLAGRWRSVFVCAGVMALYFDVFVGLVQSFQKIPALHTLAPTGQEPTFAGTQAIVLVTFVIVGVLGVKRFRPLHAPAA